MRTIQELDAQDQLTGLNVSDTLAFCIVASDYMRARRRRFPLQGSSYSDCSNYNVSFYMSIDTGRYNSRVSQEETILIVYPQAFGHISKHQTFLWNYSKEY